jgi:proteic killer suppression protein
VDIFEVELSEQAKDQLIRVPLYIAFKLQSWISGVQTHGLREMKKILGYHDEPLKGNRIGQRSIRLNKAYRAFYIINKRGMAEFIEVIEVNKHEY